MSTCAISAPPAEKIYPVLPSEYPVDYRITQCSSVKQMFEVEYEKRSTLHKKYSKAVNTLANVDVALGCAGAACGTSGVVLLATVVAAPAGVGLGASAVVCSLLGVCGKFVARKLAAKVRKHNEIRVLAESKLDTISDRVTEALLSGVISDADFKLIQDEVSKYQHMKAQIQVGGTKQKEEFILQGRNEARAAISNL